MDYSNVRNVSICDKKTYSNSHVIAVWTNEMWPAISFLLLHWVLLCWFH